MLELDASGVAYVGEAGIEIVSAPEGIRFEPLTEDHELLYSLVGFDEKFAAHNAAMWEHGLLVHVPRGVVLEKPLYVRIANSVEGGSLFWRLLVVAEPESRFSADRGVRLRQRPSSRSYTNAAVEIVVQQAAKVEYVSVQNLSRGTWHFASHHARVERDAELDWVAGGFGSAKGQGPDPERPRRPRRDLAGDGRLLRRRDAAPRLRHVPGAHGSVDDVRLRVQGRAPRHRARGLARDDPRRGGRAEDERVPGEPEPAALEVGARGLDSRARDHGQRRPLHPRRDARPGRPRAALLPDDPRPDARRGRAPDRARVLPGRPRPRRARAGARRARGTRSSRASRRHSRPLRISGTRFAPMDTQIVPRLRGVFHQYAFFAALVAGVVLVVLADGFSRAVRGVGLRGRSRRDVRRERSLSPVSVAHGDGAAARAGGSTTR